LFLFGEEGYLEDDYSRRGRLHFNTRYRFKKLTGLHVGLNSFITYLRSVNFFMWAGLGPSSYRPFPGTLTRNNGVKWSIDPYVTYVSSGNWGHKLRNRWYRNFNFVDKNQTTLSDLYFSEYQIQKKFDGIGLAFTGGVNAQYSEVESELYDESKYSSTNGAGYLQFDQTLFGRLNLTFGGRYEYFSIDTASEAKPVFRFGVNYEAARALRLRGSWGQGYRFPSVAEKFVRTSISILRIFPNPELHSEQGWSGEVGFNLIWGAGRWKGFVDMAAFWSEYKDMMEFTYSYLPGPREYGFQSVNIGNTRIKGLETIIRTLGEIGYVTVGLSAGYVYIDPRLQDFSPEDTMNTSVNYNVLKYRFRHTFDTHLDLSWMKWESSLTGRFYSFMEAIDREFNVFIPGVKEFREQHSDGDWVFDLTFSRRLGEHNQVSLIINNFTNNEYMLRPALLEPPRHLTLKWSATF